MSLLISKKWKIQQQQISIEIITFADYRTRGIPYLIYADMLIALNKNVLFNIGTRILYNIRDPVLAIFVLKARLSIRQETFPRPLTSSQSRLFVN